MLVVCRMFYLDVCSIRTKVYPEMHIWQYTYLPTLHAQGFAHHVTYDHNMWDYIYFSLELDRTDTNDQNAIQLFVHHQVWPSG